MTKINITVPAEFLKEIDETAKREKISRSELFRRSVLAYWQVKREQAELEARAGRIRWAMRVQEHIRSLAGDWDGVAEIRKWREAR